MRYRTSKRIDAAAVAERRDAIGAKGLPDPCGGSSLQVRNRFPSVTCAMPSPDQQKKIAEIRARYGGLVLHQRYRLGRLLGMGGMGAVFQAADELLGRDVAVKVMILDDLEPEERERHRRRFRREARMAAGIRHANVVVVHDFGTQPDERGGGEIDYLVMELLEGHTLAQQVEALSRADARVLLPILAQAAEGVAAGHARGIVHRDVKPGNLFLSHRGDGGYDVKVVDFGLARPAEDDGAHGRITTASGNFMSREYASPEQQRGSDDLGPQTDVFSLGVVAYRLFAGTHPFTVEDQGRFNIGAPVYLRSPSAFAPEIPGRVERVIMRALQPDPERRHPDAGALAEELREVMSALDARPSLRAHAYHGFDTAAAGAHTEAVETKTAAAIPYVAPRVPAAEPVAPNPGPRVEAPALAAELRATLAATLEGAAAQVREWRARPLPPVPPKVWRMAAVIVFLGLAVGVLAPTMRGARTALASIHDWATTSDAERMAAARQANEDGRKLLRDERPEDAVARFRTAGR
jgi:tRNA A-37 threonylcarbamoyl transferase component Bud32